MRKGGGPSAAPRLRETAVSPVRARRGVIPHRCSLHGISSMTHGTSSADACSCLASLRTSRRAAITIREHATASHLTEHQRAVLLRQADAADRQGDWWLAERIDRRFGDHETTTPLPFPAEPEQGLAATRQRAFERGPADFDVGDKLAGAVDEPGATAIALADRVLVSRRLQYGVRQAA